MKIKNSIILSVLTRTCTLIFLLFTSLDAISQFDNCNTPFDNINLATGGDFESINSLTASTGGWEDEPDCFVRIFTPDLLTINQYNHLSEQCINLRSGGHGFDIVAGEFGLTEGLWGKLQSPLVQDEDYVITVMSKPGPRNNYNFEPAEGLVFHFDNENFTNLTLPFSEVPFQPDCLPFVLPDGQNAGVALYPSNLVSDNPIIYTVVSSVWIEQSIEFNANSDYSGFKFYPTCSNQSSIQVYEDEIDEVCIVPKSDNPISVSFNKPEEDYPVYKMDIQQPCTQTVTLDFHISTSFVGNNTDEIKLKLNVDGAASLAFEDGNGTSQFDSDGVLTISSGSLNQNGIDVTASFNVYGSDDNESAIISVQIASDSPTGYLCHTPTCKTNVVEGCKGDFDGNGIITAFDLSEFISVYGTSVTAEDCGVGDFDNDGLITASDLSSFLSVFGTTCTYDIMSPEISIESLKIVLDQPNSWDREAETLKAFRREHSEIVSRSQAGLPSLLKIYPNPISDNMLNVEVKNPEASEYMIYNVMGQIVHKGAYSPAIDISDLNTGVYIIQVNSNNEKLVERFIKE